MNRTSRFLLVAALSLLPAVTLAGERFDGNWNTTMTCPAKGKTDGYTWQFVSVVSGNNLRGERGTPGEPAYFLLEGKIAADGGFSGPLRPAQAAG